MPRLSIIIPVLSPTTLLEAGLVSVLQHRPADSEVIVVLTGVYDDPYDLRDENVRFVSVSESGGWLDCVNRGLAVAAGEIMHLLGCGAEPGEDWADRALQHFDNPQVAAVAPLVLDAQRPEQILTAGIEFWPSGKVVRSLADKPRSTSPRQSQAVLGPSAIAAFYRAEALMEVGSNLDAAFGAALADADLAMRLRAAGYQAVLEPTSLIMARGDMLPCAEPGPEQARHAERLYWRHVPKRGRLASLASHAALLAGETAWSVLGGRGLQTVQGRLQGIHDALSSRRPGDASQAVEVNSAGAQPPATVPITTARRTGRQRLATSQRPLRRSA